MSGLQIWNASGQLDISITDRITRLFGTYAASAASGAVTFVDVTVAGADPSTHYAYCPNGQFFPVVFSGYVRCYKPVPLANAYSDTVYVFAY